jgi:hypothetical protein
MQPRCSVVSGRPKHASSERFLFQLGITYGAGTQQVVSIVTAVFVLLNNPSSRHYAACNNPGAQHFVGAWGTLPTLRGCQGPEVPWYWRCCHCSRTPTCCLNITDCGCALQLEEDDTFKDFVNRDSWHETVAIGDANMRSLQAGDTIQLERKGFFKVDEALTKPGASLLLFSIPDGHSRGKKGL